MARHYVTFGQTHTHSIHGITLDKDSVACFNADRHEHGREKAFMYFSDLFFTDYHDEEIKTVDIKEYFPRGIIEIEKIL